MQQLRPFATQQSNEPSACVSMEFITHVFYACSADITDEAGRGRGGEHPYISLRLIAIGQLINRGNVTEAEFISSLPMQRMHEVCQAKSHFGFIRAGTTFCLTLLK